MKAILTVPKWTLPPSPFKKWKPKKEGDTFGLNPRAIQGTGSPNTMSQSSFSFGMIVFQSDWRTERPMENLLRTAWVRKYGPFAFCFLLGLALIWYPHDWIGRETDRNYLPRL